MSNLKQSEIKLALEMTKISEELEAQGRHAELRWPNLVMTLIIKIENLRGELNDKTQIPPKDWDEGIRARVAS